MLSNLLSELVEIISQFDACDGHIFDEYASRDVWVFYPQVALQKVQSQSQAAAESNAKYLTIISNYKKIKFYKYLYSSYYFIAIQLPDKTIKAYFSYSKQLNLKLKQILHDINNECVGIVVDKFIPILSGGDIVVHQSGWDSDQNGIQHYTPFITSIYQHIRVTVKNSLLQLLQNEQPKKILIIDIGCGRGELLHLLAREIDEKITQGHYRDIESVSLLGIDSQQSSIDHAARSLPDHVIINKNKINMEFNCTHYNEWDVSQYKEPCWSGYELWVASTGGLNVRVVTLQSALQLLKQLSMLAVRHFILSGITLPLVNKTIARHMGVYSYKKYTYRATAENGEKYDFQLVCLARDMSVTLQTEQTTMASYETLVSYSIKKELTLFGHHAAKINSAVKANVAILARTIRNQPNYVAVNDIYPPMPGYFTMALQGTYSLEKINNQLCLVFFTWDSIAALNSAPLLEARSAGMTFSSDIQHPNYIYNNGGVNASRLFNVAYQEIELMIEVYPGAICKVYYHKTFLGLLPREAKFENPVNPSSAHKTQCLTEEGAQTMINNLCDLISMKFKKRSFEGGYGFWKSKNDKKRLLPAPAECLKKSLDGYLSNFCFYITAAQEKYFTNAIQDWRCTMAINSGSQSSKAKWIETANKIIDEVKSDGMRTPILDEKTRLIFWISDQERKDLQFNLKVYSLDFQTDANIVCLSSPKEGIRILEIIDKAAIFVDFKKNYAGKTYFGVEQILAIVRFEYSSKHNMVDTAAATKNEAVATLRA